MLTPEPLNVLVRMKECENVAILDGCPKKVAIVVQNSMILTETVSFCLAVYLDLKLKQFYFQLLLFAICYHYTSLHCMFCFMMS